MSKDAIWSGMIYSHAGSWNWFWSSAARPPLSCAWPFLICVLALCGESTPISGCLEIKAMCYAVSVN